MPGNYDLIMALREFTDLYDVNRQVRQWLAEVANQGVHRETGSVRSIAFNRKRCDRSLSFLTTTASPAKPSFIRIYGCHLMAIASLLSQKLVNEVAGFFV